MSDRNAGMAIAAEFFGTTFFVMLATGAVAMAGLQPVGNGLLVSSLAFGIAILVVVAWTANISGGHINPAVTLAMMITSKISPVLGVGYVVAQFAGAALGALLVRLYLPAALDQDVGLLALGNDISRGEAYLVETLLTLFLVTVVFNTAVSKKGWGGNAPIAIGLAVTLVHFASIPLTGTSVNPARAFGPALVNGEWTDFDIFLIAPVIGAVAAAVAWIGWRQSSPEPVD